MCRKDVLSSDFLNINFCNSIKFELRVCVCFPSYIIYSQSWQIPFSKSKIFSFISQKKFRPETFIKLFKFHFSWKFALKSQRNNNKDYNCHAEHFNSKLSKNYFRQNLIKNGLFSELFFRAFSRKFLTRFVWTRTTLCFLIIYAFISAVLSCFCFII